VLHVLKFQGNLHNGFNVTFQSMSDRGLEAELHGELPPSASLQKLIEAKEQTIASVGIVEIEQSDRQLISEFQKWLNTPFWDKVEPRIHEGDRLEIHSSNTEIWRLPWHQWHTIRYNRIPFSFALSEYDRVPKFSLPRNPRILAIESDRKPGTREFLSESLEMGNWDILSLCGHGSPDGKVAISDRESITVSDIDLPLKSAIQKGLQVLFLNSCHSISFLREAVDLGLPVGIAYTTEVEDREANHFLELFLEKLSHQNFYEAFTSASIEVEKSGARSLPILYAAPSTFEAPKKRSILPLPYRIGTAIVATTIAMLLQPLLQIPELAAFDFIFWLKTQSLPPVDEILVIEVDQEYILEQSERGDDLTFDKSLSDRSLKQLLKRFGREDTVFAYDLFRDRDGHKLEQIWQQNPNFIAVCSGGNEFEPAPPPEGMPLDRVGFTFLPADRFKFGYPKIRRALLMQLSVPECPTELSLAVVVADRHLGRLSDTPPEWVDRTAGAYSLPTDWILGNQGIPGPVGEIRSMGVEEAIASDLDPQIVIVGRAADADEEYVPGYGIVNGPMVHALHIAAIIKNSWVWWLPQPAEFGWLLAFAICGGASAVRLRWWALPLIPISAFVSTSALLYGLCLWLPSVGAALSVSLTAIVVRFPYHDTSQPSLHSSKPPSNRRSLKGRSSYWPPRQRP